MATNGRPRHQPVSGEANAPQAYNGEANAPKRVLRTGMRPKVRLVTTPGLVLTNGTQRMEEFLNPHRGTLLLNPAAAQPMQRLISGG